MSRVGRRALLGGAIAGALSPNAWADELPPLTEDQRKLLASIPSDPPAKKLSNNQHFLVSDEQHPERMRHALAGLGGVFVGVGPEQNYSTRLGPRRASSCCSTSTRRWSTCTASTGLSFAPRRPRSDWWSCGGRTPSISPRLPSRPTSPITNAVGRLMQLYRRSRDMIHGRLGIIATKHRKLGVASFLNDAALYGHVRSLVLKGRTVAVRGDLTGDEAMRGVARVARALKEPVRGLYLSNVEFYVDYASGLDDNCRVQPTDARSKILRTVFKSPKAHDRYHYCEQRAAHFRAWLDTGVEDLGAMIEAADERIDRSGDAWVIPGPA